MAVPNSIIASGKMPILGQFSFVSPKFALFRLPSSILLLLFLPKFVCPNTQTQQPTTIRRNEMLVPLNSTTALICEPVFNQGRPVENGDNDDDEARWMRDGREVARVNGHRNALIGANRGKNDVSEGIATIPQGQDPIPEIGFLLIRHTQREDEGEYWCERLGQDRQQGERTRLRVAYLEPFPKGTRPRVSLSPPSDQPERGQLVVLDCPRPNGLPAPIISWQFNGEELRDFPALNLQMATNGSLLLHNFSTHQSGFYACEAVNFVAKTRSEPIFLGTPLITNHRKANGRSASTAFVECLSAYVRNGVLWFLIGCLTTSCIVLAYILGALFLYRLYSIRDRQHHRWPRSLFAAPGFRKVIAPMAERMAANHQPPPYESPAESDTTTMTRNEQQFDV